MTSNSYAQSDLCQTDVPLTVRNPSGVTVRTAALDPTQLAGITLTFILKNGSEEPQGHLTVTKGDLKLVGPSCYLVPLQDVRTKVPSLKRDGTEYTILARLDATFPGDHSHTFRAMNSFFLRDTTPLPVPTDVRIIP